jgi:uncharacterized protein (DUF3820 family)
MTGATVIMPVQQFQGRNTEALKDQMIAWLKDNGWTMPPKEFRRG